MDQDPSTRPASVGHALTLLYSTLGIGLLRSLLDPTSFNEGTGRALFILASVLGVLGFLFHKIGTGKNWARVTVLVLFVIGLPFAVLSTLHQLDINPIAALLGFTQGVMQIVALWLLFQRPSSEWFTDPPS